MTKPKVLSLGALAMDIVMESSGLPQNDGFSLIRNEVLTPGGSASNMSVALQLMGAAVYQTGKIGDDRFGKVFRQDLVNRGVNVDFLPEKKGGTTLHTYVITAPEGRHCIFANLGDCVTNLEPEDLPEGILDGFACFYTDMFSPRASLWLAEKARKRGIPVVYNMQCVPSFMQMCGVEMSQLRRMLALSTVVVSGREAFCQLTGKTGVHDALNAMAGQYKPGDGFICTVGDEGALWHTGAEITAVPAFCVNVQDSTGAGDCFAAGLVYSRYCTGGDMPAALRFACASAALKCLEKGPRAQANANAIEAFIQSRNR